MQGVKLGKKAARNDPRTLRLASYVDIDTLLPKVPATVDWTSKVPDYRMLLNNQIGDCAIVAALNTIRAERYTDSGVFDPTDEMALEGYERIGGYDPNAPLDMNGQNPTDGGCVMDDVMNAWRRYGIGGHRIGGWGAVTPTNHHLINAAIYLFGPLPMGFLLPEAIQGADRWSLPSRRFQRSPAWAPGSWGGHAVPMVYCSPQFFRVVSWGRLYDVEWSFGDAYCDEIKWTFSADLLGPDFKSPYGFSLADLQKDMQFFKLN